MANISTKNNNIFCGAHGCVITKNYCCLPDKICPDKITKIFFNIKERNEEFVKYTTELKLNAIDNEEKYFIGNAEECNIKFNELDEPQKSKLLDKINNCNNYNPYNPNYPLENTQIQNTFFNGISYTNGGLSLLKFIEDETNTLKLKDFIKILQALGNVFEGLVLLHTNGIYHLDLKPENIVIKEEGDAYHCRIIDFGDSFVSQFTKENPQTKQPRHKFLQYNRTKLDSQLQNKDKIGTLEYMSPEMFIISHKTLRQATEKPNATITNLKNITQYIKNTQDFSDPFTSYQFYLNNQNKNMD